MILRRYSVRGNDSAKNFNLGYLEVTRLYGQFQICFSDAFEHCSDVFDQLFRCFCGNLNVVYILVALVSFDDCVQVFSHEPRECRHCPTESVYNMQFFYFQNYKQVFLLTYDLPSVGRGRLENIRVCKTGFFQLGVVLHLRGC